MTKVLLTLVMFLFTNVFIINGYAQSDSPLFAAISDEEADLTTEEAALLESLRTNPAYESITMVNVEDFWTTQQNGIINITISGEGEFQAMVNRVTSEVHTSSPADFTWEGAFYQILEDEDGAPYYDFDGVLHLVSNEGEIFGKIEPYNSQYTYELVSFAPGRNALIKYDNDVLFADDECASYEPSGTTEKTTGPCNTQVKVLVCYTTAAKNAVPNINNTINLAMSQLDGAKYNSTNQSLNFTLAASYELTSNYFVETPSNSYYTLTQLKNNPQAQYLRNVYKADIVVCLTDGNYTDNILGLSYTGLYEPEAYGIVEADEATSKYSFCHEVGHIMGAQHQQSSITNDHPNNESGYHHGYKIQKWAFPSNKVNTDIMHVLVAGMTRSHMFSTPDKQIWGKDMGKVNENDVTRMLLENVCTVSEFRTDNNPAFFDVTLAGKSVCYTGESITVNAFPTAGIPIYTYEWYMSTDGGNSYTLMTTTTSLSSSSVTFNMPAVNQVILWVKATSAANEVKVVTKTIYHISVAGSSTCCPFTLRKAPGIVAGSPTMVLYPNPASDNINIIVNGSSEFLSGTNEIVITDIVGNKIISKKSESNEVTINTQSLNAGTYFIKLKNGKFTETKKVTITK